MKLSDDFKLSSSDIKPEQIEDAKSWLLKLVAAYANKDETLVSKWFKEDAVFNFIGVGKANGLKDIEKYFAWTYRAVDKIDFVPKSAHFTSDTITLVIDGTALFLKGDPLDIHWVLTLEKKPEDEKVSSVRAYKDNSEVLIKRFAEHAGPLEGISSDSDK